MFITLLTVFIIIMFLLFSITCCLGILTENFHIMEGMFKTLAIVGILTIITLTATIIQEIVI